MNRKWSILAIISLLIVSLLALTACSNVTFQSITKLKSHENIDHITIVNNTDVTDGHIVGSIAKDYYKEKDILAIYNILSKANYRVDNGEKYDVPEYEVRIYVKGKTGYINYAWDKSIEAKDSYSGKVKSGKYSMDGASDALDALKKIFFDK